MSTEKEQYERWLEHVSAQEAEQLREQAESIEELHDAFYRELAFGTAGLRGIIGLGPNRMNVYTVGKATQGLADYLNAHYENPSVAIARDSRNMGEEFVSAAACVLAANGIVAHVYRAIQPTPVLSFTVRDLHCSAGINVTASHNPAAYNGYKVYGADGCQITLEVAAKILAAIEAVDCFAVQPADFDAALAEGKIEYSSEKCLDDFVDAVYAQRVGDGAGTADLKLVYTPLNGSGLECVKKLLAKLGVTHVTVVPEQEKPDGNFPTCPYPNPAMAQPNQPSVAQERFGRSSGRLTASQVIETCATILAGVILLGLAWTNPQPYAPVDLIAGLSGAAALIVGVRLPQVRPMLRSWPALWLALGGIILIVAAARYEASLKSMRTIAARIGDLR